MKKRTAAIPSRTRAISSACPSILPHAAPRRPRRLRPEPEGGDYVKNLFIASTHDYVLFFTNTGRVHRKKGYLIPEAGRTARGTNIVNILPLEQGERVTAMLLTREFTDHEYLMMVTRGGTVKRIRLDASIPPARPASAPCRSTTATSSSPS